ncbi:MAG: RIP metalloprotease RseP [Syntrophales bacterium]|nr:RIP metalloprotease RseP [Syntrophales bacterium]
MIGTSIVSVVVLLGALIFIHEFGHFLVAKWSGVGVLKFSLGFGPRLIGRKVGETEYMLSLIPLGGYVKLLGEEQGEELSPEEEKRSFAVQKVWKRIAIVAAGPIFNLLLAVLIFTVVNIYGMPALTSEVGTIQPDSAAFEAGMQVGDKITAIDQRAVKKWDDIAVIVTKSNGKTLLVAVQRGSALLKIPITPKRMKASNIFGEAVESYKIGISPAASTQIERLNPALAFVEGLKQTGRISKLTVLSIVKMFEGVVSPKTMGGPIFIAQIAGAQAKQGVAAFLLFMALLSINLGILNLLPIPVLDGGHLFFMTIELITGKEVKQRWREMAQQVGFTLLILLMIFVFLMDIERLDIRFISDFIRKITG